MGGSLKEEPAKSKKSKKSKGGGGGNEDESDDESTKKKKGGGGGGKKNDKNSKLKLGGGTVEIRLDALEKVVEAMAALELNHDNELRRLARENNIAMVFDDDSVVP